MYEERPHLELRLRFEQAAVMKRKAERRGEAMGQEFPLGQEILLGG